MKKCICILHIFMITSINIFSKESLDMEAAVRVGYQSHETSSQKQEVAAAGIMLHAQKAFSSHMNVGVTLFGVKGRGEENFEGVPFFDGNNDDYASVSEAYLQGRWGKTKFILGRQMIDTPFADSDDIGMVPNTFEACTIVNKNMGDTTLFLSHIQKWSGVDSESLREFTNVNGNRGMQVVGLNYEGIASMRLSGWYYHLSGYVDISYLEASWEEESREFTYAAAAQFAYQDYVGNESSSIWGTMFSFGHKASGLTLTVSYNKTNGIAAENFFGGGPFFTNAEHNTLKESGADGDTLLCTLGWDASAAGIEGLSFVVNIDEHIRESSKKSDEYDMAVNYEYNKHLAFNAVYSDVNDGSEQFKNLRIFVNYHF